MSPRLRRFTSRQLMAALHGLGFEVVATRGSHAKLRRVTSSGERQTLTLPLHHDLATGTVSAIFRQLCRYVPEPELRRLFFDK
jgi:predicted RNA binding protein YcfA (HicA-like mRNA interferase family)